MTEHTAEIDAEHFPWHYTEFGVVCACGASMRADETCPAEADDAGVLAPRCPRCGWQRDPVPDISDNHAAAVTDVAAHKRECPGDVVKRPGATS